MIVVTLLTELAGKPPCLACSRTIFSLGAREALDEALTLALPTGELQRIGPVAAARAESAWYANNSAAVLRETERGPQYGDFPRGPWFVGELLFWKSMGIQSLNRSQQRKQR